MSFHQLTLKLKPDEMPQNVADLFAEADRRCDEFFAAGLGRRYPRYIPSDPSIVHAAMVYLKEEGFTRGNVFCEWGCGYGVATCLASLLGYEAYGIEIEPELADLGTKLAEDCAKVSGTLCGWAARGARYETGGKPRQSVLPVDRPDDCPRRNRSTGKLIELTTVPFYRPAGSVRIL